jgi:hypothetical protein
MGDGLGFFASAGRRKSPCAILSLASAGAHGAAGGSRRQRCSRRGRKDQNILELKRA